MDQTYDYIMYMYKGVYLFIINDTLPLCHHVFYEVSTCFIDMKSSAYDYVEGIPHTY